MTIDDTAPESGSRPVETSSETQRAVGSEQRAHPTEAKSEPKGIPEGDQSAAEKNDPTRQSEYDYERLGSPKLIRSETLSTSERFAFWTLLATAGLAAATLILALATVDMARSTRQLADLAKQQASDTQDALAIGRRQANAAEMANQLIDAPLLGISNFSLPLPTVNTKYLGAVTVYNAGRAAAVDVSGAVALAFVSAPKAPPGETAVCENCGSAVLFPTTGLTGQSLSFDAQIDQKLITSDVVKSVQSKSTIIYMTAAFAYKDTHRRQHHIHACVFYKADENQSSPCTTGNSTD